MQTLQAVNPKTKKTPMVMVGMSGGVDSSVTAALLREQGYRVVGIFMKNWEDSAGDCQATEDFHDVERVCRHLNIPCYSIQFVKEYRERVFNPMVSAYRQGLTPNPDILCNQEIKFKEFFNQMSLLGADYLATGHYCRNQLIDGTHLLCKGRDTNKDQSYFLYTITEKKLQRILFPVGNLLKEEVRRLAFKFGLPNHDKKDSTGICFIGKRNFKGFLSHYLPEKPGNFERLNGEVVGTHDGAVYYTTGQRKGLKLGGPGKPWFVVGKDMERNVVLVERGADHPALYSDRLIAKNMSFVDKVPQEYPFSCQAKIRYRQTDQKVVIEKREGDQMEVRFIRPQQAITKGQSVVFYQGDRCLGGGIIKTVFNNRA